MPRTTTARADAIEAAARLFDRRGYHGAGLADILAASGAPRGSFYFHFPGGKEQLGVEAIRRAGGQVVELVEAAVARDPDPVAVLGRVTRGLARWLERSDYSEGCAVSNVALETAEALPALREACADQYDAWVRAFAAPLAGAGVPRREATRLARTVVGGIEGALLMCRASRSTEPLHDVSSVLCDVLRARTSGRSRRA